MKRRDEIVMALAVLVVDRDAAVKQFAEFGGGERSLDVDREQRLDLVENEAAVAVGAGDQRIASLRCDRKLSALERFGAADELAQGIMAQPPQDQHLAAR